MKSYSVCQAKTSHLSLQSKLNAELWFPECFCKWVDCCSLEEFYYRKVRICFFFQNGEIQPVSVKVGEKVLLPEYGGTKIVLEDKVGFPTVWVQIRMVPEMPVINTVVTLCCWHHSRKGAAGSSHLLTAVLLLLVPLHKGRNHGNLWPDLCWVGKMFHMSSAY